jgi:hypothetical protein
MAIVVIFYLVLTLFLSPLFGCSLMFECGIMEHVGKILVDNQTSFLIKFEFMFLEIK